MPQSQYNRSRCCWTDGDRSQNRQLYWTANVPSYFENTQYKYLPIPQEIKITRLCFGDRGKSEPRERERKERRDRKRQRDRERQAQRLRDREIGPGMWQREREKEMGEWWEREGERKTTQKRGVGCVK